MSSYSEFFFYVYERFLVFISFNWKKEIAEAETCRLMLHFSRPTRQTELSSFIFSYFVEHENFLRFFHADAKVFFKIENFCHIFLEHLSVIFH